VNIMALNSANDAIEAKRLELVAALRLRGRTQREPAVHSMGCI
jgi:hypothetical protein